MEEKEEYREEIPGMLQVKFKLRLKFFNLG